MTEQQKQYDKNVAGIKTIVNLIGCELDRIELDAADGADWRHVATTQHHRHQLKMELSSMMGWNSEEEMNVAIETAIEESQENQK